jgi:hypothetical protein
MTRPLYSRILSVALSFWLALFLGGSEWIVRCPTHGGGVQVAGVNATGGGHSGAVSSGPASGHDHGVPSSAPSDHETGHSCSCPGPGCCPPVVAVVPGASVPLAHVIAVHEGRAVVTLDRLASASEHVLPFATAPPTVALAPATSST